MLTLDDITLSSGSIHYWTFFKKFYKFAYLNPKSNHSKHVFKGLLRGQSVCVILGILRARRIMTLP